MLLTAGHRSSSIPRLSLFPVLLGTLLSTVPLLHAGTAGDISLRDAGGGGPRVVDGVVMVKLKAHLALSRGATYSGIASLDKAMRAYDATAIEPAFPFLGPDQGPRGKELQRLFYLYYRSGDHPRHVALQLARDPSVEYAVPKYVHRILGSPASPSGPTGGMPTVTPNDPLYSDMTHLPQIKAPEAWDVVKGEQGNVVIAIVDGGTEWDHQDLRANVWTNLKEIIKGVDDDNNGFVDDVHGWNFANNSNDPRGLANTPVNAAHGTEVAGVAAAVTNNSVGVAGASWNATFMPINASCPSDSFICWGDAGIAYAAENGAHIINASWGSPYDDLTPIEQRYYLQSVENLMGYITEKGALLISSAGNDNVSNDAVLYLPAGNRQVLAVGATIKAGDEKAWFSNYGVSVDVFAPGLYLNTTIPGDLYTEFAHGTSFSAPLVAGIAALVKTRFPHLSPLQLAQQVRVTADPIDDVNPGFAGRLGRGRINAYRAVTDTTIPAIRVTRTSFTSTDTPGMIENGDIVDVSITLRNFLADAAGGTVTLTTGDPLVTITTDQALLPPLFTGDTVQVDFQFTLDQAGDEHLLLFTVDIDAGSYQDRDIIRLHANEPKTLTHNTGPLRVSITTEGNIGWTGFADESYGEGFVYNGVNLLFEGGLLVGTSQTRISDCIRGTEARPDKDFGLQPGSQLVISAGQIANEEGSVVISDHPAPVSLDLIIQQDSYADNDPARDDFVIFRYTITNTSSQLLSNLFAGLFFDWDINADAQDYTRYDSQRRMGSVRNSSISPSYLAATCLLTTTGGVSYRSIHNPNEIYGGEYGDGFTAADKWEFLSGGLQTLSLNAVDVSTLMASGPLVLEPGRSVPLAFAVIGAGSVAQLEQSADSALDFWENTILPAQSNHPPVFTAALRDTTILSETTLIFDYAAEDTDGDSLRYATVNPPQNASIDSLTGRFTFQPALDQVGDFKITTIVSDSLYTTTTSAMVTVKKSDYPPVFTAVLPDTTIASLELLTYQYAAQDMDGDNLTFGLVDPPANATIDRISGILTYQPAYDFIGSVTLTATVTDGVYVSTTSARIVVEKLTYYLGQNYSNPFQLATQGATTIDYHLAGPGQTRLVIYDLLGREVRALVDDYLPEGIYQAIWYARDNQGKRVGSGVYFYRLQSGSFSAVRKLLVLN